MEPRISICIPAYKNPGHLKRLLDSIRIQSFTDYEIVITDDSPDNSVHDLVTEMFPEVIYSRNLPALGTPANWNAAIARASGTWIKLMHNDDWFTGPDSLKTFHDATQAHPEKKFFFSAFQNVVEADNAHYVVKCSRVDLWFLKLNPYHLVKRVYVGNPSCTMVHRDIQIKYDTRYKFIVDFDYYIRCFRSGVPYAYIDPVLLNIGFHKEQVTTYTFREPKVQIPENMMFLEEHGIAILNNIIVYDYFWRLFRNLGIRSAEQAAAYYPLIPPACKRIIRLQSRISPSLLKVGILSKSFMFLGWLARQFSRI